MSQDPDDEPKAGWHIQSAWASILFDQKLKEHAERQAHHQNRRRSGRSRPSLISASLRTTP